MTSFKQYLTESAGTTFASWTMSTLLDAYNNAGYELTADDRKSFKACKFNPKSGKKPYFWVLCKDDASVEDDSFYITTLHLEFTADGKIGAEPAGMPNFEGTSAEMKKKFESL